MLQSMVELRNWLTQNVPGANSMPGQDLFMVVASLSLEAQPLQVRQLLAALPYPPQVVQEVLRMALQAGLLLESEEGGGPCLRASARFVALLDAYQAKYDSLFIPRSSLRASQLVVQSANPALRDFAVALYDRFYDLGWLYLHQYGATCFTMAALVRRAAQASGHQARIAVGYVEAISSEGIFLLGGKGYAGPGQIDGHAACIVDESLLIDFGLGNLRRQYQRSFYWGVACDYQRAASCMAELNLPNAQRLCWKDDWQSPGGPGQIAADAATVESLFKDYQASYC